MVIKDCILKGTEIMRASGVENPMLDARVLMCRSFDKSEIFIMTNPDLDVPESVSEKFFAWAERRAYNEPLAYIINEKEFMSMSFYVDENVLIPRPDTEHLAELAIELAGINNFKSIADFCTGSGALAIAIAKGCPKALVKGCDISDAALEVAGINKERLSAENVSFFKLDVLSELPALKGKFDLVVSNPPYIDKDEMKKLDETVDKYEPHLALFGGDDGLDFYRTITENADCFLNSNGVLAFEVGHTQASDVADIMKKSFNDIRIKKDYAGIERVVWGVFKNG